MKKVLSLVLAVVLVLGMATVAFARVSNPKLTYNGTTLGLGASGFDSNSSSILSSYLDDLTVRADDWIRLPLDDLFTTSSSGGKITESQLRSDKITVRRSVSKGSNVIRDIDFNTNGGQAWIRVRFIKEHVSTKDIDFDFKVYLMEDGSKLSTSEISIAGTLKNTVVPVYEDDDYINLSDNLIAEAKDYIRKIEIEGGNGVSITTNMFEGKKYYFTVSVDVLADDEAVLNKYPEIDAVYYLNQVGLATSGNVVEFDISDKYYVYNADGKYVGTTDDKLPFSSKYYVSTKQISMTTAAAEEEDEPADAAPTTPSNPPMGGDDTPANANDNPGTGANGFVNVAVAAGMVSLAAAAAVTMKK